MQEAGEFEELYVYVYLLRQTGRVLRVYPVSFKEQAAAGVLFSAGGGGDL